MDIEINVSDIIIESERLLLRAWQESDLNDMFEYASVDGVGEMAGWPHHKSIEDSQKILNSFIEKKDVFAVVHKFENKVIGSLGLHYSWANDEDNFKDLKSKEIGYVLSKNYWGQGLMPEAVTAVIKFCFDKLGADILTCGHFTENNQSKRVIEKCGFKLVKHSKYNAKQLQREFDDLKYVIKREDIL